VGLVPAEGLHDMILGVVQGSPLLQTTPDQMHHANIWHLTLLWGGPGPGVLAGAWVGMLAQQGWQGW